VQTIRNNSSTIPLLLVITVQVVCASIFLFDVFQDYRNDGFALANDFHLIVEIVATAGLVAAIYFEIRYLRRLLRHQTRLLEGLSIAASAMHDIILDLFGKWKLTPSEQEVAMLLVKGFSIAEIAAIRGGAEGTVKAHLNSIYKKSGTGSRGEVLSLLIDPLMATPLVYVDKRKVRPNEISAE
jgi:DNA-binding CsgD family transcriptional regulator